MHPHDREQILGMMDLIDMYIAGELGFYRLVAAIEGRMNTMSFPEESFLRACTDHWGSLERTNAIIHHQIEQGKAEDYAERAEHYAERIREDALNMRRFLEGALGPEGWTPRPET